LVRSPGTPHDHGQLRGGSTGREREVCALMREEPEDDATSFRETPWVEVIDVVVAGDSPLAHAVHRRQREIRCPEPVVAGHDSVI
jgi:hypothetical protein